MLAMGLSKPSPDALKAMTGEDKMDATAIIDYLAPLKTWLMNETGRSRVQDFGLWSLVFELRSLFRKTSKA